MTAFFQGNYFQLAAAGKIPGADMVNKFGRNPDVDAGTEDLWTAGGLYTGFPTGAPESLVVVSTDAGDTGVLQFTYLATSNSTVYQVGTVQLNGITPVNTGVSVYRVHTAQYSSGTPTTFNLGTISGYHAVTTANVFFAMPIGRSQTNVSAFTVPANSTGYIMRLFGQVRGAGAALADLNLWVRTFGGSPRLRRPNELEQGDRFNAELYGGLVIPERADVILQVTTAGNNLDIIGGYDILIESNTQY